MPWPVSYRVKNEYSGVQYIFQLMQRPVEQLVEYSKTVPSLRRLIIFGSSVRCTCSPRSDIDIFVEGCKVGDFRPPPLEGNIPVDIIYPEWLAADDPIIKEIIRDGVVVYERDPS